MTDWSTDAQHAADRIANLGDTTPDTIYRGTQDYDARAIAAAAAAASGGGASGGDGLTPGAPVVGTEDFPPLILQDDAGYGSALEVWDDEGNTVGRWDVFTDGSNVLSKGFTLLFPLAGAWNESGLSVHGSTQTRITTDDGMGTTSQLTLTTSQSKLETGNFQIEVTPAGIEFKEGSNLRMRIDTTGVHIPTGTAILADL